MATTVRECHGETREGGALRNCGEVCTLWRKGTLRASHLHANFLIVISVQPQMVLLYQCSRLS